MFSIVLVSMAATALVVAEPIDYRSLRLLPSTYQQTIPGISTLGSLGTFVPPVATPIAPIAAPIPAPITPLAPIARYATPPIATAPGLLTRNLAPVLDRGLLTRNLALDSGLLTRNLAPALDSGLLTRNLAPALDSGLLTRNLAPAIDSGLLTRNLAPAVDYAPAEIEGQYIPPIASDYKITAYATPEGAKSETRDDYGQYSLSYATDTGIRASERAFLKPSFLNGNLVLAKEGSYSYISPEGIPLSYSYTADENGFNQIENR